MPDSTALKDRAFRFLLPDSAGSAASRTARGASTAARSFQAFHPEDAAASDRLVRLAWAMAERRGGQEGLEEALSLFEAASQVDGPGVAQHALMVFATHFDGAKGFVLPTFLQRFPDVVEARRPSSDGRRADARALGGEAALDWWREDPFFNEHHEHWHFVYTGRGVNGVPKDRHGELFLYMHEQMLARYDTERVLAGLERVAPLGDLNEPITEAYESTINGFGSRPADARLRGVRLAPNFVVFPQDLEDAFARILGAVEAGALVDHDGQQVPLGEPLHMNRLGNTLEANVGAIGDYGNIHNLGHVLISTAGEGQGVMGTPVTSAMDPVFWRWHKRIDDVADAFRRRLDAETFADAPSGLRVHDVIVCRADQVPDFESHDQAALQIWASESFGPGAWDDDFAGDGDGHTDTLSTREVTAEMELENTGETIEVTYGDHDDFAWVVRLHNASDASRRVTVRLWLCLDEHVEDRGMWIEMDTFEVPLEAQERKAVYRSARQSSVVRKRSGVAARPPVLETRVGDGAVEGSLVDYCDCGWPYSLLLPRGTEDGAAFTVMAMVTEGDIDMQGEQHNCGSVSLCGARGRRYPDQRPMGYPFHARWAPERTIAEWIEHLPSATARRLTIKRA